MGKIADKIKSASSTLLNVKTARSSSITANWGVLQIID